MIESKRGQRLVGLLFTILFGALTYWLWYEVLINGNADLKMSFFPAFLVMGLGLLLAPMDMEEFRKRTGLDRPQSVDDYPTSWRVITALSVIAAMAHFVVIYAYSR